MAREAKALIPSAAVWIGGRRGERTHALPLLKDAVRVPDPFLAVRGNWVLRRLAPDCTKIDIGQLPRRRDDQKLLRAMGWETANLHLATRGKLGIASDLDRRPERWLERASDDTSAVIRLRLFDGARAAVPPSRKYLVRLRNGAQQEIYSDFKNGPDVTSRVPFYDNLSDNYTVNVTGKAAADAGFFPVHVDPEAPSVVDLMLLPKPFKYDFDQADWDLIEKSHVAASAALAYGASTPAAAKARYDALLQTGPQAAALWNILTSMGQAHLTQGTTLDYLKEIIWNGPLAPAADRFFGYADIDLIEQMEWAVNRACSFQRRTPACSIRMRPVASNRLRLVRRICN